MGKNGPNDACNSRLYQKKSALATIRTDAQILQYTLKQLPNTYIKWLAITAFVLGPLIAFSQNPAKAKAEMEKGKSYIQLGEFETAKKFFEDAVNYDAELYEAQLFLADCYFHLKQWDDAAWYYKLVYENDPKAPLRVLLQAAEANFNNQNFHDALNQLKTFLFQTGISNTQKEKALKLQRDVFFAKDAIRK